MIFELAASWFWLMDDLDSSIRLSHESPQALPSPQSSLPIMNEGILIIVIFWNGRGDKSWLTRMWCVLPIIGWTPDQSRHCSNQNRQDVEH